MCTFITSSQVVLAPSLLPLEGRRVNFSRFLCGLGGRRGDYTGLNYFQLGFSFFLLMVSSLYILGKNLLYVGNISLSVCYLFSPNIVKICKHTEKLKEFYREHHTTHCLAFHLHFIKPAGSHITLPINPYFVMYFKVNSSQQHPFSKYFTCI